MGFEIYQQCDLILLTLSGLQAIYTCEMGGTGPDSQLLEELTCVKGQYTVSHKCSHHRHHHHRGRLNQNQKPTLGLKLQLVAKISRLHEKKLISLPGFFSVTDREVEFLTLSVLIDVHNHRPKALTTKYQKAFRT